MRQSKDVTSKHDPVAPSAGSCNQLKLLCGRSEQSWPRISAAFQPMVAKGEWSRPLSNTANSPLMALSDTAVPAHRRRLDLARGLHAPFNAAPLLRAPW